MSYKKHTSMVPQMNGQFLGTTQMPIRQLLPQEIKDVTQPQTSGMKSRNPGQGKGQLRQGNSLGVQQKNSSTFGANSSKSPVMAKSFAIPNNQVSYVGQTSGNGGKHGSIGYKARVTDFDNPLTSNTVDFTQMGASQKDNQMMYKMMIQGGTGRQQKNLASSYLRGIDSQLRGNNNN